THIAIPPIYPLSLHDALPIFRGMDAIEPFRGRLALALRSHDRAPRIRQPEMVCPQVPVPDPVARCLPGERVAVGRRIALLDQRRSEEHTSELQSRGHLVCRLL